MKLSPKQTLEKLLPIINDIFKSNDLDVTAYWKSYHYKNSCGFIIKYSKEIENNLHLLVNDPNEKIKLEFWDKWSLIIKEVDNFLMTKFNITSRIQNGYFRTLKLIDNDVPKILNNGNPWIQAPGLIHFEDGTISGGFRY